MSIELVAEPQLVGTVTGGYRVLSQIGSGTMGHVYEAEDVNSGNHVALKVLRRSHQKDLAARFLREGKTLALLSHPNIVQLVDMGQLDDGTLFLATELVTGGSLREVMNGGVIEQRRALRMIRQLLDALDAAHAFGVVHRDIKPENVMVAGNDSIKVLDFGVAKLLSDTVAGLGEANLTTVGFSIFGSALYIAPESVTGEAVDARIDLYSTGAMLMEMIAGRPPFDDPDPAVLLRQQAFDPPPTLAQVAPTIRFCAELEALVAKALAKRPDDRFRSAADMIEAVDGALRALQPPVVPRDERRATTVVVRGSSRTKLAIAAGAAALLVLIVTVVAIRRSGNAPSPATRASKLVEFGDAQLALGRQQPAVAAYERALRASPSLATDPALRKKLLEVLAAKDPLASVIALDLLAAMTPPAHDAITTYAASGKHADARHRAVMIGERDGLTIDRVASWSLDLQQATTCDERKLIIESMTRAADKRALTALRRVRAMKCVEREASDAIARIEASAN
jgi:eukaryotic-like serine/threonine-protein kinase